MREENDMERREFLKKAGVLGAVGVLASKVCSAAIDEDVPGGVAAHDVSRLLYVINAEWPHYTVGQAIALLESTRAVILSKTDSLILADLDTYVVPDIDDRDFIDRD